MKAEQLAFSSRRTIRYLDLGSDFNQYLIRPAIGRSLSNNTRAWIGYARLQTKTAGGSVVDENRYWQQLDWRANGFMLRARFEQRDLDLGDDLGLVLRLMARYSKPLGTAERTSLILAIEPFINLRDTDWGAREGLTQNRTFLGLGFRVNDQLGIDSGYLNQYVWVNGAADRSNHIGVLNVRFRF